MAFRMHAGVCACCSRYREKHTVKLYSYTEVPNLQLLSVNGPRSADMPRHVLTTQSGLCLQPAACRMDGADLIIALCDDCHKDLERAHIPLTSLVYVDTGGIPKSPVPELNLAPLSLIEEQLLSFNRVIRMVYVFHPTPDGRSVRQYQMRGNVIAFLNAPVTDVMAAVPLPLGLAPHHNADMKMGILKGPGIYMAYGGYRGKGISHHRFLQQHFISSLPATLQCIVHSACSAPLSLCSAHTVFQTLHCPMLTHTSFPIRFQE